MSYNSENTAKALVGQALSQALLDVAQGIIHWYTPFRWGSTDGSRTLSIDISGQERFFIDCPVLSVTAMTVDAGSGAEAKTEGTDFYVDYETGEVYVPGGLPGGVNNVVITYKHGFLTTHPSYQLVLLTEAQIALYIKRNPAELKSVEITGGLRVTYGKDISGYLRMVPTLRRIVAAGPEGL